MTADAPAPPIKRPERLHLSHVEGLRAIAALNVYVNHAYAQSFRGAAPDVGGSPEFFYYFMVFGHLSVSVFIVISGFCLALPAADAGSQLRRGMLDFMRRRARRILPPYYAAVALCLVLIFTVIGEPTGTLWDVPIVVDWKAIVAHLLLVQDFFRTSRINYVFWSIAVEWHIYWLFPLFLWGVRRFGIGRVVLASLAIGYALRFGLDGTRVERANPQFLGLFAAGMAGAYVVRSIEPRLHSIREHVGWGWLAAAGFGLTFATILAWGVGLSIERYHWLDLPTGIGAAALLVYTSARADRRLTRWLSLRPLVFVGTFSYSVYLVHAPLLQVLWQYAFSPLGLSDTGILWSLLTLGLTSVLAFSYVFHLFMERPFMSARARGAAAVTESAAAPA